MTDPVLGHDELASAQSQPEVVVNAATRKLSAALAGRLTHNFASDANYSLAIDGAQPEDDEWPYHELRFTDSGVVLTAARDVIYPDVDTEYVGPSRMTHVVINDTAETLTIKRSGQTGVPILAGERAMVRHNGTDIESVSFVESVSIQLAGSNLSDAIAAATGVAYIRAPKAFTLTGVRASLLTACSTGTFTVDINVNGSTILSTKLTIDATEVTSVTATPAVISNASISDDDLIEIDIDDDGDGSATGLIVSLLGVTS